MQKIRIIYVKHPLLYRNSYIYASTYRHNTSAGEEKQIYIRVLSNRLILLIKELQKMLIRL